jgi:hypothetical protein
MLLSASAAGMFVYANSETLSSYNLKQMDQASYVAEAGVNKTLEWLQYTYPSFPSAAFNDSCYPVVTSGAACGSAPILLSAMQGATANYPDATAQNSFQATLKDRTLGSGASSGKYAVTAKLLRHFTGPSGEGFMWQVHSVGTTAAGAKSELNVIVSQMPITLPTFAALSCATGPASIVMGDSSSGVIAGTDSYDSSLGPYGGLNVGTQGNIGSNGEFVQDGQIVNGNAQFASTTGAGTVNGTSTAVPQVYDCSKIQLPKTSPGTTDLIFDGGTQTITPGSYRNILCTAACTLNLTPGVYTVNSLEVDSGSKINISGRTQVNVVGTGPTSSGKAVYLDSDTVVNPGPPADFIILVNRPDPVTADSGVQGRYVMIAPLSQVYNDSNTDVFGMVVGKTVIQDSGARIHFDIQLKNIALGYSDLKVFSWEQPTF